MPSPRMGPGVCVKHGLLYLYGGTVEDGDKQFTLNDMFALGMRLLCKFHNCFIISVCVCIMFNLFFYLFRRSQNARMGKMDPRRTFKVN